MNGTSLITARSNMVVVTVSSYENKRLRGEIYSEHYQKTAQVNDSLELLFAMEQLMDSLSFPKIHMEPRTFNPKKGPCSGPKKEAAIMMQTKDEKGEGQRKATFVIHVQFRRNASWQGEIRWVDEGKTQIFRSTLEMIKLIDDALESTDDADRITWELE
ncbi:hypothetical protein [Candidatus Soleaferrea massiliensis]|uniref:hypothetical protein n=1 Tax=Candidatus Soleaferrea massiliensis TaxID=1470354 RepID=UPI0009E3B39D|nr:hypothetical protein [Candidatus Soleaferrea massiliensis]